MVEALLEKGADANIQDEDGEMALYWAAGSGRQYLRRRWRDGAVLNSGKRLRNDGRDFTKLINFDFLLPHLSL